jgi:F0F1-type ATP synthase membrane subunit c/vacuolar-type H+-ATPase subunit K
MEPAVEKRIIQTIYFAMLGAALMYLIVLQALAPQENPNLSPILKQGVWALASASAAAVIFFRQMKIMPILERPAVDAATRSSLRAYYIISFALSEAVLLYGFVLRMLGATVLEAGVPYVAGLVLFAINYPRWPGSDAR